MSQEFNDVYKTFLNLSHQERVNVAGNATAQVIKYLEGKGAESDLIGAFFGTLLGLFIGADGKITPSEADIYNQLFGTKYSPNELVDYVNSCLTKENYDAVNGIVDNMDKDNKYACCYIVLAIITDDGEIDETEAGLFEELLA